jgi:outer membrane lipoprotein-sorting protein
MRASILFLAFSLVFVTVGAKSAPAPKPADAITLQTVLQKMDAVAADFRTAQADFEWDNYQRVIDDVIDVQTGTIYYRRVSNGIEMKADIKKSGPTLAALKPDPKFVLVANGKARMYLPQPDQVTEYDLAKNHSDLESYMVLGFGGSGQDLQKAFDVTFDGTENINGVATAKLQLVPKSENVRKVYNKMILWIDPEKGVSVQQQFFTAQGDYRLCKYSSIKMKEKIGDEVFKLKTTSKTQTITAGG